MSQYDVPAWEELREVCEEFVQRCETGEVRSSRTYRRVKEALSKLPPKPPTLSLTQRVFTRLGISTCPQERVCNAAGFCLRERERKPACGNRPPRASKEADLYCGD